MAAPVLSAAALEAAHAEVGDVYPLGSTTLTMLTGGAASGEVTEVVGAAGAGKTQVAISSAVAAVLRRDVHVLYLTTASPSTLAARVMATAAARIAAALVEAVRAAFRGVSRSPPRRCCSQLGADSEQLSATKANALRHVLSHIHIVGVTSVTAAAEAVACLAQGAPDEGRLRSCTGLSAAHAAALGMVILDSFHALTADALARPASSAAPTGKAATGKARAAALERGLKALALARSAAVIVTTSPEGRGDGAHCALQALAAPRWGGGRGAAAWAAHCAEVAAAFPPSTGAGGTGIPTPLAEDGTGSAWAKALLSTVGAAAAGAASCKAPGRDWASAPAKRLLLLALPGTAPDAPSSASVLPSRAVTASVQAGGSARTAPAAWSHAGVLLSSAPPSGSSRARIAAAQAGGGADGAAALVAQQGPLAAALVLPRAAAAGVGGEGGDLPRWHAAEWAESALDLGVALFAVDRQGVVPPLVPVTACVTAAASAWAAAGGSAPYTPPPTPARQRKFAALPMPAAPGAGLPYWAAHALLLTRG